MVEDFFKTIAELEGIASIQRSIRNIDGWLTDIEGISLYYAAKYGSGNGAIVEIGSFKGKSTIWLAKGSQCVGRERVYAIDTHLGSPEHRPGGEFASHMPPEGTTELVFRRNIEQADVADWILPLIMSSDDAVKIWHNPIRLLFIDADHSYEAIRNDFIKWQQYVIPGGLIALHDVDRLYGSPKILDGPTKVVYEDIAQTHSYSAPLVVNHLAFVTKIRSIKT